MRQLLSFFAAALLCCCIISCSDQKTGNSVAEKNLTAMHIVHEAFRTGDAGKLADAVATDFVDHTDRGDMIGIDSLKKVIAMAKGMNMKMEVLHEIADSNFVYSRLRFTGVGDGVMMPAVPYDMHSIEAVRCKDGKIVEHWGFMDMQTVMKMMPQSSGAGTGAGDRPGK